MKAMLPRFNGSTLPRRLSRRGLLPIWAAAFLASGLLPGPAAAQAAGALRPHYLRCECRVNPLGIGVTRPRLSWLLQSEERGQRQTAYQVLVASAPERLSEGRADLWDSGKVVSSDTIAVVYKGKPLTSGLRCYWKARVWDAQGRPSDWSPTAYWSMGLLKPADWKAQWIGYDKPRAPKVKKAASDKTAPVHVPPAVYLRKEFQVKKTVRRASLYASALGWYRVRLNGRDVHATYFDPGWTDYNKRVYYRTYDVTELVRPGDNALGATLSDGWYSGYIGWGHKRNHYGSKPRFLGQLVIEYTDGSTEVVATGPDWRASTGPIVAADILMGETYDARKEMPGWDKPGFNNAGWARVDVGAELHPLLQPHPGPPVVVIREFHPKKITEPKPGVYVIDMGQNFAGVVRLKTVGRRGRRIRIRHAERLNPDGTIYTRNLRSAKATDTYICRGGGRETWSPRFTFHGFQYIEITGLEQPPSEETVTGLALSSDTPTAGEFACSDPMLNKLHSNIYWTQRANFIDIPTDCPQRDERLGWTGDAQVYIRTATLNADVQAFFTKWLADLEDAQRADGQFPMVAPLKVAGDDGGPAWADAGVICPWTIYEVYGDRRLLETHYDAMKRFIAFCEKRSGPDLLPPKQFHCFGDWLNIKDPTPKEVIYTAYFAYSAKLTAQAAEALGRKADAARYRKLYRRIKQAFNRAYVSEDGRIKGDTQTDYVLAIAFDLVDGKKAEQAAAHLVRNIRERNWHLSTGFIGTKDLMLALAKIGRNDVAYRLIHNDTFPSWGFSIKHGATTIWERWDGWTPEKGFQDPGMNSFAHYSFGAVYQWMVENIGGIRNEGPAYKRIRIEPDPDGKLTWARVGYRSIRGWIRTAWKRRDGRLELEVAIPPNTTAVVSAPTADPDAVKESGRPLNQAPGVRTLRAEKGRVELEIESGTYRFSMPRAP